jgi:putative peptidoglycan lipid II flippase
LHLSLAFHLESVRTVVRNFFPVFISRGVVQISAYVDALLASLLPTGAVAALAYAQTLYTLPVSLFGMSVSAAELPVMSGAVGAESQVAEVLRARLNAGLRQIAFFVIPSVAAFLILGDVIVSAIYQSGRFTHSDANYVWGILVGSTVGLLASTLGRLYSSTYYALKDTRTPLNYALIRVALTTVLGYLSAIPLPHLLGIDSRWGVSGLTASAGIASWIEFTLLRRTLNRRIGSTGLPVAYLAKGWGAALAAAGLGRLILVVVGHHNPILIAVVVLGPYGIGYFAGAAVLGVPEVRSLMGILSRMRARFS